MATEETQEIEGWQIKERLGYGAFSFAHKATRINPTTGQREFACAKFTKHVLDTEDHAELRREQQAREIQTEVETLQKVDNPWVVKLFNYNPHVQYETRNGEMVDCHLMVLELCQGGTLFDVLYYTGRFTEPLARTLFKQVLSGVEACHHAKIGHRDIKAQNIVLDQNYQCKLIDFGSSKRWQPRTQMTTTRVGTKGYQAPEMLMNCGYTYKIDIFAMGVLLFIMLARSIPFQEAKLEDKHFRIIAKGDYARFWQKYDKLNLSDEVKDFLNGLLCYQPLDRLKIAEIKAHDWYNGETIPQDQLAETLRVLHRNSQEAHAEDKDRSMEKYNSLTGAIGDARGDNDHPEIPTWLKPLAFELEVTEQMDGEKFLQMAQTYVTDDLQGNVEYDQENSEMVAVIQLRTKKGEQINGAVRINVFSDAETDPEECVFVTFRRADTGERDNDAAALWLQEKLKVLFDAF